MKLVLLIDGSGSSVDELADEIDEYHAVIVNTQNCNGDEYNYLFKNINNFSKSNNEIMLVKYSGKESVIKELGDECPEMILGLSYNTNSKYYNEFPKTTISDLVNIFKIGDYNDGIRIKTCTTQ